MAMSSGLRRQRRPDDIAIDAELLAVLRRAVEELPQRNRDVARYIIGMVEETGERPTYPEIARQCRPPVSDERGRQLFNETMARLEENLKGLSEDGRPLADRFREVFGIHKHAGMALR